MTLTLTGFMLAYLIAGYFLFSKGLGHIKDLPGIGSLLTERIFYLMFFLFFVMLLFSNTIIAYTMIFRSKETSWLMSLPLRHRTLFIWKIFESLVISSWGLIFISTPLIAAHGQIFNAPTDFYLKAFFVYLPFVTIPAAVAAALLLLIIRFTNKIVFCTLIILAVGGLTYYAFSVYTQHKELGSEGLNVAVAVNQVLRHTNLSVHPLSPSTWMADVLLLWGRGYTARGYFFGAIIISYSLMGMLITWKLISHLFYPAWNASHRRRALSSWNRKKRRAGQALAPEKAPLSRQLRIPGMSKSYRSLIVKDYLIFWRDPAQWVQFVVIFGLLFVYILNLRNMGYDYKDDFWSTVIAHLNLGVCALALSTLTTRFVFPQFSIEGRRLWILGLAPFSLSRIVLQKFWMSWAVTGTLTIGLIGLSGFILELPPNNILMFSLAIGLMSVGLTALAVGLGTLFPNLRETNPAKIVSGFGGTLCLILSFVYILVFIGILAIPAAARLSKKGYFSTLDPNLSQIVALSSVVLLTLIVTITPLFFAAKRVKKLEFLGNL
jgi:ABC-2 type transport system permease protein